jgi:hypothetical protein
MFNQLLDKVEGADIWMVLSLSIFLAFFIGATIYTTWFAKKDHIIKMKNLPLSEEGSIERSIL